MENTVAVYCGVPRTGKTTLAIEHAAALCAASGVPLLVVDSGRVENFRSWIHADTLAEVAHRVYDRGEHVCFFPRTSADFDRLVAGVYEAGDVVLLVDELKHWANARRMPEALGALLRSYRHRGRRGVSILATTQSVRDLALDFRVAVEEAHVFFTDEGGDLEVIRERWGIEPDQVRALSQGQFAKWRRSDVFLRKPNPVPPPVVPPSSPA